MEQFADCALFITGDSGPMHIAALSNIPMITIWGPTSAQIFGYETDTVINIETEEACSPCFYYAKSKAARSCDKKIDCLTRLQASRVVDAAKLSLEKVELLRNIEIRPAIADTQANPSHFFAS